MMSEAPADDMQDKISPLRDPRHVFLDAREVMRRYGWGRCRRRLKTRP
jgi:hypothetical protein